MRFLKQIITSLLFIQLLVQISFAQSNYISHQPIKGGFTIFENNTVSPLFVSEKDFPGVVRAAHDLQQDIQLVTSKQPSLFTVENVTTAKAIIIGTIGKSPLIDDLIARKKIEVNDIKGKWETFVIETIKNPYPGVKQALVIIGSDKRGTIFGIYDMSEKIGVSPWHWWADVPVPSQSALYVKAGKHTMGEPKVKYRGIFINDEQPALGGWVRENYGGFNSKFYVKVFELILRLKGNFLWPAMWGQSFYSDDPLSPKLADEYGIVISTSHHEPMMRAHAEWGRNGGGAWDYSKNAEKLRAFWKEGIERMGDNESIVTLAMRGDGDEPMSEDSNIQLLQRIVRDQREILEQTTGKNIKDIPQVWALYKEVQDYYDKGMRVPDDITLLLCDDNWGNIRKLPSLDSLNRPGGYGIYYHFDYVGGPRNYKWLNTSPITRTWEQMHLAYNYGANRIWVVNVGDIKPMEFPISFFLDYAWNPEKWNQDDLDNYTQQWAEQQFGKSFSKEIASIIEKYTKFNARRKPELLAPDTYSLIHYNEAEKVVSEYKNLANEAQKIYEQIAPAYRDAYYQLVLYPVLACSNLNEMKVTAGLNHLYAYQDRATTNSTAEKVEELFHKDKELSSYYNTKMADGKWNHFMDQTHISYTYWQQPNVDVVPEVEKINLPNRAEMGVAIEGSEEWWPRSVIDPTLPEFDVYNQQSHYIEIFNQGTKPFDFKVSASEPWIKLSEAEGKIDLQKRIIVSIDWSKVPTGSHTAQVTVEALNEKVVIKAPVVKPASPFRNDVNGFMEGNGYVSIEAVHYANAVNTEKITWKIIPDLGRTLSAMTCFPVTFTSLTPGKDSPHLEYPVYVTTKGEVKLSVYVSPTIDFRNKGGLRYAISIDEQEPQVINIHRFNNERAWEASVANSINVSLSQHKIESAGHHIVKLWAIDPGVVFQKIVLDMGGVEPSYLGPPESFHNISSVKK